MLRESTRSTQQYASLKHLHLSGNLIDDSDTSPWQVKTPNRADVVDMLDKMVKAVDKELCENGLLSIGDTVLPHIQHWDRLATLLRDRAVAAVTVLPLLLGVSALLIVAVAVITPIYLSFEAYKFIKRAVTRYQHSRTLDKLREREGEPQVQGRDEGEDNQGEDQRAREAEAGQAAQEV